MSGSANSSCWAFFQPSLCTFAACGCQRWGGGNFVDSLSKASLWYSRPSPRSQTGRFFCANKFMNWLGVIRQSDRTLLYSRLWAESVVRWYAAV